MGKRSRGSSKAYRRKKTGGSWRLGVVISGLVLLNLYVFLWRDGTAIPDVMRKAELAGSGIAAPNENLAEPKREGIKNAKPAAGSEEAGELDIENQKSAPATAEDEAEDPDDNGKWVDGVVQKTDSLGRLLKREGLDPQKADEVIRSLTPNFDMKSMREGQKYRLHMDASGRVLGFEYEVSKTQTIRASRDASGALISQKVNAQTRIETKEMGGVVTSSLYMAVKDAGEDTSLVGFFVDVFAYDLNFYVDSHEGDTFRLVMEKEFLGNEFLRYGRVLAAEYSGRAGTFRAFWWQPSGEAQGRYFNDRGESIERTFLKTPLKYARVSSKFNPKRMHPILHVQKGHFGVDYAAPTGTPIWAASNGKIVFRGHKGGAGNCVILQHDRGLQTIYMHLSKFQKGQSVGQRVTAKQVIGYVGATGLATGPHLHFSVKQDGHYVDPLKMKMSRGEAVAAKDKARFSSETQVLVDRLAQVKIQTTPQVATGQETSIWHGFAPAFVR